MTFLNPLALFGLAAAAIPIILHLLNLRKLKTVEFSTLQFLKELQKTKMRRVKIRQLLLLIIRTLLIAMLVLAFSRPTLRSSLTALPLSGSTHVKSTIVILMDDSPSMSVRTEHGLLFTQAKDVATRILALAREGDEVQLIRLSDARRTNLPDTQAERATQYSSAQGIKTTLPHMAVSQQTARWRDAFGIAAKILAESKNFNQEVYLITDGQATHFLDAGSAIDTTDIFESRARIFVIPLGSQVPDNSTVSSIEVKSQIITLNKPVTVEAVVRNHGRASLRNTLLNVYLAGSRVLQQSLTIPAHGATTTTLSVLPKRRGILEGYMQLEDDALDIDNTRYFTVNVPENIRVLLAGNTVEDTKLPTLALTLGGDSSSAGLFSARQISEQELSSIDVLKFDVLVLCGIAKFSPTVADRIAQHVKAGSGLMIFPGKASDLRNYNQTILSRLGIPSVAEAMNELSAGEGRSFLSFSTLDLAHPLFTGMFEQPIAGAKKPLSVESPRVYKSIVPAVGQQGQALITLGNGSAFLTEYPVQLGRVFLFSVEAGITWSDFPVKGLFAPLVHRAVIYLATQSESRSSCVVGDPLKLSVRMKTAADRGLFVMRSPSGNDERIVPRVLSTTGVALFEPSQTAETGFYELRRTHQATGSQTSSAEQLVQAIAVNVNPTESDLRQVTDDELRGFWARIGITPEQTERLEAANAIDALVLQARFGMELWKYCVGLALILALLEMAIGREPKTQHLPYVDENRHAAT